MPDGVTVVVISYHSIKELLYSEVCALQGNAVNRRQASELLDTARSSR